MKRIISFVMLLAMLVVFCSCANNADDPVVQETTASLGQVDDSGAEAETTATVITDDLSADLNFDDRTINVASSDRSWWVDEVTVPDLNGEHINDAVYNRKLEVENRLGVKINNIKIPYADSNSSTVNAVKNAVLAGTPDYDIVYANAYVSMTQSLNGIYTDLYDMEYLNLSKPYWASGVNEAFEYHGSQYAATGSIALSTMRFAFVTIFNKNTFDNRGIEYLYNPVREGKWTLDYQYEILKNFYNDANGSNTADTGDYYGFITNDYICTDPYWVCCELPIIGRDANGDYTYVLDTGKLSDVVDKLLSMYEDPGTYCIAHKTADAEQVDIRTMFAEGHGAMTTLRLIEVESNEIRMMEDKYGIVPMPKLTEEQENYHTLMHDQFTVVSVTATVKEDDYGVMGAFMEAMASESHKTVIPAYYETTLKYKYSSDPESWEMLDIVVENINTDAGIVYTDSLTKVHQQLRTIIQSRTNTVVSTYKGIGRVLGKLVGSLNEKLAKLADK